MKNDNKDTEEIKAKETKSACPHFGKWEKAETDADCKWSSGKCQETAKCLIESQKHIWETQKPDEKLEFTHEGKKARKLLLKALENEDDSKWLSQSQIATLMQVRVKKACAIIKEKSDVMNYQNVAQRNIKHDNGLWYVTFGCYKTHFEKG